MVNGSGQWTVQARVVAMAAFALAISVPVFAHKPP